ncbi:hypothetical protein PFISCL1PPCAC_28118, partial [Pristionchus fissidentatus]
VFDSLDVIIGVVCAHAFFDEKCLTTCEPYEGRHTCHPDTGDYVCVGNRFGESCSAELCLNGSTFEDGKCKCTAEFAGARCNET